MWNNQTIATVTHFIESPFFSVSIGLVIAAIVIIVWSDITMIASTTWNDDGADRRFVIRSSTISLIIGSTLLAAGVLIRLADINQLNRAWLPCILGGSIITLFFAVLLYMVRQIPDPTKMTRLMPKTPWGSLYKKSKLSQSNKKENDHVV